MPPGAVRARLAVALATVALVCGGALGVAAWIGRYTPEPVRGATAVGDATCLSCHAQHATFETTAHRLTSTLPSRGTLMGSFSPAGGANVIRTSNPRLYYRMDSTAGGFYETAVTGRAPDTTVRRERIDYVTGVRKGQSYLYWNGDRLYQLPISYWVGAGWANSPAYPDGRPNFDRAIPPRCLECHATSFNSITDAVFVNRYQHTGAVLGITCETCHGAGAEHVRRERTVIHRLPASLVSRAIVNPARLPRARQVDGCALCHSGVAPLASAAFAHVPGTAVLRRDALYDVSDSGTVDVHGNQVALLERSRCYRQSQMTCATCHDVHREQRDVAALSGRCLTCHTTQSCGLFPQHGQQLAGKCVGCHMPLMTSQTVVSSESGTPIRVGVRSHWIKVYPPDLENVPPSFAAPEQRERSAHQPKW